MNPVLWAQMQSLDVLESVERMIPDLCDEEDFIKYYSVERLRDVQGLRQDKKYGKEKVAVGISLVGLGVSALLMPGNAAAARAIQLTFQLGGAYIGSFFGPQGGLIGFGIGTIVGGIVAGVWVYGIPLVQIGTGLYLIASGLIEMM